jgi:hypothetical protein
MSDSESEDDVPLAARVGDLKPCLKKPKEAEVMPKEQEKGSTKEGKRKSNGGNAGPKPKKEKQEPPARKVKAETTTTTAKATMAAKKLNNGVVKKETKGNTASNGKEVKVKRERKTYEMPGQTKETPDETDPIRKFYESLSTQKPDSAMAQKWLMQHGMLPREVAQKLHDKLKRSAQAKKAKGSAPAKPRANAGAGGSPTKTPTKRENTKKRERDIAFEDGGL